MFLLTGSNNCCQNLINYTLYGVSWLIVACKNKHIEEEKKLILFHHRWWPQILKCLRNDNKKFIFWNLDKLISFFHSNSQRIYNRKSSKPNSRETKRKSTKSRRDNRVVQKSSYCCIDIERHETNGSCKWSTEVGNCKYYPPVLMFIPLLIPARLQATTRWR